jgi:hypothetical protein
MEVAWRIVIECWIIECEMDDAWMAKSSKENWMLVMQEEQWRLDMKNVVVVVVSVVATVSPFVYGCSMTGDLMVEENRNKEMKCVLKLPGSQGEVYLLDLST